MGDTRPERVHWAYLTWRYVYTVVLLVWGLWLLHPIPQNEIGPQPAWFTIIFGVLPTILFLVLAYIRPSLAQTCVIAHGSLILAIALTLLFTLGSTPDKLMSIIIGAPLFGFIAEGTVVVVFRARDKLHKG